MNKSLGVLCHVSSIPSQYGVGDFGKSSFEFIDFLANNKLSIWQILPLNKTSKYNCPYSSQCCYSFDEMYVNVEELLADSLIEDKDLKNLKKLSKTKKVAFAKVKEEKNKLLEKAFLNLNKETIDKVKNEFKNSFWLYDYAYYRALLSNFKTENFRDIDKRYWNKDTKEYQEFEKSAEKEILKYGYFQYLLDCQWQNVRKYAKSKGIKILGDVPIYPDPNSFDVFANADNFKVDKETLNPLVFGGVPKDEFCEDGQNWGTCVYDWDHMKKDKYKFMINKIQNLMTKYDILRLDHFLGYVEHYEWDAKKKNVGKWNKIGGEPFFKELKKSCNLNDVVIEDLGINKLEAKRIKKLYNLKGMCVVQLILEAKKNIVYLPDKVQDDCIYYLGTHDNNTYIGYLRSLAKTKREKLCNLMGIENQNIKQIHFDCIKKMLNSKSQIIILQMQDYLLQNEKYRMNVPGQAAGCWEYKVPKNYKDKMKETIEKILK